MEVISHSFKNKSICFVHNGKKTIVFKLTAKILQKEKIDIHWIVTNKSEYNSLCSQFAKENVLLINRDQIKYNRQPIGDFKINELVFGDRVWSYEKRDGIKYLTNIQQPIYDFIKGNNINYIFGETTWAYEILIQRICKRQLELCCRYYSDHVIRIPNGRFVFFKDEKQTEIVELSQIETEEQEKAINFEKPSYLAYYDKLVKAKMSIKGLFTRFKYLLTSVCL
jgi:hypothetical protein